MDAADEAASQLAATEEGLELPPPADPPALAHEVTPEETDETADTPPPDTRDDPLVRALDDPDDSVRFEAMSALGDRLEDRLLPVIEPLLYDRDRYVRQYAVEYYAKLRSR